MKETNIYLESVRRLALGKATVAVTFTALSMMGWASTALADGAGPRGGPDSNGQDQDQDHGGSTAGGGNVYAATNALTGNAVRVYHRSAGGRLTLVRDTPTGRGADPNERVRGRHGIRKIRRSCPGLPALASADAWLQLTVNAEGALANRPVSGV